MILFHRTDEVLKFVRRGAFHFHPGRKSASISFKEDGANGVIVDAKEAAELGKRLIGWAAARSCLRAA